MNSLARGTDEAQPLAVSVLIEHGLTVEVSEADLERLTALMRKVIDAGDATLKKLREIAGPQPSPVAQHLVTMMNLGTGHFRHTETTMLKLFKARAKVRRERQKKEGA